MVCYNGTVRNSLDIVGGLVGVRVRVWELDNGARSGRLRRLIGGSHLEEA